MLSKLVQPEKAYSLIVVILFGIIILVNSVQFENA